MPYSLAMPASAMVGKELLCGGRSGELGGPCSIIHGATDTGRPGALHSLLIAAGSRKRLSFCSSLPPETERLAWASVQGDCLLAESMCSP